MGLIDEIMTKAFDKSPLQLYAMQYGLETAQTGMQGLMQLPYQMAQSNLRATLAMGRGLAQGVSIDKQLRDLDREFSQVRGLHVARGGRFVEQRGSQARIPQSLAGQKSTEELYLVASKKISKSLSDFEVASHKYNQTLAKREAAFGAIKGIAGLGLSYGAATMA